MSKPQIRFCTGDNCPYKATCFKYLNGVIEQDPGLDMEWIKGCDGSLYEQKEFYGN